jgi:hypothetical protein
MFRPDSNKIAKLIIAALVCVGILAIVVFQWTSIETIYHFQTQTEQCPVSEAQTGCSTLAEHMSSANSILVSVLPSTTSSFLVFLLLLAFTAVFLNRIFGNTAPKKNEEPRYLYYTRDNPDLALFDHLKLAFARGILNPKIY